MRAAKMALLSLLAFSAGASSTLAAPCTSAHAIRSVRNGVGGLTDYVRFEINGPRSRPYTVKSAHPPFLADPSGETVSVAGDKFKQITFTNVVWTCEIAQYLALPGRAVRDVKKLGQFEGVVDYVIGYRARSRYLGAYAYRVGARWRVVLRFLR